MMFDIRKKWRGFLWNTIQPFLKKMRWYRIYQEYIYSFDYFSISIKGLSAHRIRKNGVGIGFYNSWKYTILNPRKSIKTIMNALFS